MSAGGYRIVFAGKLVAGADEASVKSSFQRLFKADARRVEALFSGRRVVIKKDVDEPTARKYAAALRKVGAQCEVEAVGEHAPRSPAREMPTRPVSAAAPAPPPESPPEDWQLAAPGADLREGKVRPAPPPPPDTAGLSVAPVGADMLDAHPAPAPFVADLGELSVAAPGADLLDDHAPPPPFEADLGERSLAPAGAELAEHVDTPAFEADLADLSLAPTGSDLQPEPRPAPPPPPGTGDLKLED